MIISFKMVDGSRIDLPVTHDEKEFLLTRLRLYKEWQWLEIDRGNDKKIMLKNENIISVTIKGDDNDSKGIS